MTRYLTIYVRAHEGRYHGDGDELPSPFRLFQALVAGVGISGPLDKQTKDAFTWLEELPDAPIIASPRLVRGQAVMTFVPNNDLDKYGGDVRNIAKTRGAQKVWRPRHFDAAVPWIYAWPFAEDGDTHADAICALSEKLYQLGRGVDMAWAWGEILDEAALDAKLVDYDGVVRRPSAGDGLPLACPTKDSFESLERRYRAPRFRTESGQRVFVQQPRPSYRQTSYESPPARYVFELRSTTDPERCVAWPLEGVSSLVVAAREAARARLSDAMPNRLPDVDRHLVGRKPDGSNAVPAESRVRIIAIPSIGMHYADRAIRRLLVEIPAACPLRSEDVRWAFSGAEFFGPDTDKTKGVLLSPSADEDMLRHYGVGAKARVYRSVTPVALPEEGKRRRIERIRKLAEAKRGFERVLKVAGVRAAVVQALRHAGVRAAAESIRLQREPFERNGVRAEAFAENTRFDKHRLWHVEIAFATPISGPLVIGDGRFLGLGIMAPLPTVPGIHTFVVESGFVKHPDPIELARALRRAVMARVQAVLGETVDLPSFFTGHEVNGAPARSESNPHLLFLFVPSSSRLMVISPHIVERREPKEAERKHLHVLDEALFGFGELRAGSTGCLSLRAISIDPDSDPLFAVSRVWESVTPYAVTRHMKPGSAAEALSADLCAECCRRGLPKPMVRPDELRGVPGTGLAGVARLVFPVPVRGPLILGRSRYVGGGLFVGKSSE